jgi:hypothetical protein
MKKLFGLVFVMFFLSGCVYSSANMMRAKGEYIKVFGAWGWVECKNSSITLYRSNDSISYMKGEGYPKIPTRPTVTEEGTDIVIGKNK